MKIVKLHEAHIMKIDTGTGRFWCWDWTKQVLLVRAEHLTQGAFVSVIWR
jgi:hypothetical protein